MEKEEIHNYNAVFCGNPTELYSWQMQLFPVNEEEKDEVEEEHKDEEKQEEEEEITTTIQSSAPMQQRFTHG